MKSYHPALAAVTLLAVAGCSTPVVPSSVAPPPAAAAAESPSATAPVPTGAVAADARALLLAALERSKNATYRFATSGELPDAKRVTGSGSYDPRGRRISMNYQVTGDGSIQRIVVGTDLYSRAKDGETWVHLDLKKVKKDSLYAYDMTDPTGMSRFVEAVDRVTSTGPNTYNGTLDITGDRFNEGFLPVGTPAVSVLFGGDATFTATTSPAGWVTSITVSLKNHTEALTLTTTLSDHGEPSAIRQPSNYGEAMDFYYD